MGKGWESKRWGVGRQEFVLIMLITTVAISHPPQLLSSSPKGINEQGEIQRILDSKGFWLFFGKRSRHKLYIFQEIVSKNYIFSTGESVHIQNHQLQVMGPTANPTCWSLIYPGWSTPRKLRVSGGSGVGRPGPNLHPKKCAKTSWCIGEWHLYKTH